MRGLKPSSLLAFAALLTALPASAQSFRVQCPATTDLHPNGSTVDPNHPGRIKCQHIGGGDGYATMGDGTQIYLFGFSPLSGLRDIEAGLPGTETAGVFNVPYRGPNYSTTQGPNVRVAPNDGAITEPAGIMDMGVLAANAPAPMMAIDEDDEFFLTLSNPGMIMRPDLFEQHTVHFHGYPNASSFFDGVPDASIAINIAGSFTYYYTAPEAGTYFWHCHITPPEHLQMGMVGPALRATAPEPAHQDRTCSATRSSPPTSERRARTTWAIRPPGRGRAARTSSAPVRPRPRPPTRPPVAATTPTTTATARPATTSSTRSR